MFYLIYEDLENEMWRRQQYERDWKSKGGNEVKGEEKKEGNKEGRP